MTSANTSARAPTRPAVLQPYRRSSDSPGRRRARRWAIALLAFFSLFWGMVFAFLAPALILVLLAPVLILLVVTIWALPDLRTAPTRALERFFFLYVIIAVLWPSYISIAIPNSGLPWVNPQRLIYAPMALIFVICVAVSREFRARLSAVLQAEKPILWLMIAFIIIMTYTVPLSDRMFVSMDKWADALVTWVCMFFVGCYLFSQPGRVVRWAATIWVCAVISGVIGIWEWRLHHVPWLGYLPSFLQMDPLMVDEIAPRFRQAVYRVRSTYQDGLGLGEFMSLTMPFVLCFALGPFSRKIRIAAMLTVPFLIFLVFLANARSGVVGLMVDFGLYGFYWGFMRWRRHKDSLIGPALMFSYPALAGLVVMSSLFVDAIRIRLFGGGATHSSNDARKVQWTMGLPKVINHPLGHGIGRAGEALGYYAPNGLLTIDTYYLSVMLDYGIIGFIVYYSLILYSGFTAGRHASTDNTTDPDTQFLAAASISLAAFFVIKSVYSEPTNHPFFFMVMGMVPALVWRLKTLQGAAKADAAQPAASGGGPRRPRNPAHQPARA
jgi:hypothetical protein